MVHSKQAVQPYSSLPPHMQAQRQQGFSFDPMGENQSLVSNNVITDSCTNKRSKPEMASESQLGLRLRSNSSFAQTSASNIISCDTE